MIRRLARSIRLPERWPLSRAARLRFVSVTIQLPTAEGTFTDDAVATMLGYHPPKQFDLEDLTGLFSASMLSVLMASFFRMESSGPLTFPEVGLWQNLVRLTDQGLREYEMARHELTRWLATDNNTIGPYFHAVDSLEQCIVAAHRGMLMAEAIIDRRHGRGARRPPPVWKERLKLMRNAIEHTDDRLTGGRKPPISAGDAPMLRPLQKHMELGTDHLTYRELAGCLRSCYRIIESVRRA
jgi:hypothetical protein